MSDKIIEMAREAGLMPLLDEIGLDDFEPDEMLLRFAALVRADEREQCALICDNIARRNPGHERGVGASWCAYYIRKEEIND